MNIRRLSKDGYKEIKAGFLIVDYSASNTKTTFYINKDSMIKDARGLLCDNEVESFKNAYIEGYRGYDMSKTLGFNNFEVKMIEIKE